MKTRASGCARPSAESWVFVGRRDDTPPPRRPAPAPPGQGPADPGPVLYEDSFERVDIRERWGAVQELQSDHTARTSAEHARDGARSARFEVRDGDNAESSTDERQQLSDARMPDGSSFLPKEGDDFYIAISLWFEPGFPFAEGDAAWQVYLPLSHLTLVATVPQAGPRQSPPLRIGQAPVRRARGSRQRVHRRPAAGTTS